MSGVGDDYEPDDTEAQRVYGACRRLWERVTQPVRAVRVMWRERNALAIAVSTEVARPLLADQPGIRRHIDEDLAARIRAARSPLGWRRADLRWALGNVGRALTGGEMTPLPYSAERTIAMVQDAWSIERDTVRVAAEIRRRPAPPDRPPPLPNPVRPGTRRVDAAR